MDCSSEGSLTIDNPAHRPSEDIRGRCRDMSFGQYHDMLLDDVLLEIFDFYVNEDMDEYFGPFEVKQRIEGWITLAHVCCRWRSVVFRSPRRLNLRLVCTHKKRVRDILDVWPPLPLVIANSYCDFDESDAENTIAALEHNDRVCQIILGPYYTSSHFKYFMDSAALLKPFPELTVLRFVYGGLDPILPNSFLGGTAPRLRTLALSGVSFPGLPNLLLSTTHLIHLDLFNIPDSGYIPPEAMTATLSVLSNLEILRLNFQNPQPRPALESRRPPPRQLTRSILPSLTEIRFQGDSEYLEEILARIDAPRLNEIRITLFHQIIFHTPELFQFISRRPTPRAPEAGYINLCYSGIAVKFPLQTSNYGVPTVQISYIASNGQLPSLRQICTPSLPPVSTLEDLYIFEEIYWRSPRQGDAENALWLELLHPFAAVKNLYLSEEIVPRFVFALQELLRGRMTEVLPTLENIFLEEFQSSGPLDEGIEKFVAARRLIGHPVAVCRWDRDKKQEMHWEFFDYLY